MHDFFHLLGRVLLFKIHTAQTDAENDQKQQGRKKVEHKMLEISKFEKMHANDPFSQPTVMGWVRAAAQKSLWKSWRTAR